MKQVNLVKILRSRETYDKNHPTISIYDALEAMKEACNQAIDLCAENAELLNDKGEVTKGTIYVEGYEDELSWKRRDVTYQISKQSILNTKKQII